MNIGELKKAILESGLPDNTPVILQKDAEGNGYSPLCGADPECIYIPDSTYSGEVYSTTWTAEDAGKSPDGWEKLKGENSRALVLFPAN